MPMQAIQRRQRKSKREDILQAAMRTFCHYGYDGSTLDKIAAEAGVSKALVIKYYRNQREMVVICMRRFLEQIMGNIKINAELPDNTYQKHCDYVFEQFRQCRPQIKLLVTIFLTPAHEDIKQELLPYYHQFTRTLLGNFAEECSPDLHLELNYTAYALLVAYVIGGSEENYLLAREQMFRHYLPEKSPEAKD